MTSGSRWSLFCLLLLCAASTSRGDLVLASYSTTNLLKGLAVGDSIADDCSINGAYATNFPIYNAALQKLVNQRRALGQNVLLADMYSTVDFNTMFLPDHVHPNALDLQAIAKKWLARLQACTVRTDLVTSVFIYGGASWKYNDTGQDPGTNWTQADYDDSGWSNGVARLGYGDPATATTASYGPQSNNKFGTTYFRRPFATQSLDSSAKFFRLQQP